MHMTDGCVKTRQMMLIVIALYIFCYLSHKCNSIQFFLQIVHIIIINILVCLLIAKQTMVNDYIRTEMYNNRRNFKWKSTVIVSSRKYVIPNGKSDTSITMDQPPIHLDKFYLCGERSSLYLM